MRRGARRAGRRTARRTTRRTVRRVHRRRWRRRIMVGGMVLLAAGGTAAAIKMSQRDAERIEQHTGAAVDELSEEELVAAMEDLGIQSIELTDEDQAALTYQDQQAPAAVPPPPSVGAAAAAPASNESYLNELERLADLRDRGIISEEDFEAKKKQLLGL
jgi:hypothetical protein